MPAGFTKCLKQGGKVRRIKPNKSTYINICYIGGKSYSGETHKMKKK